MNIPLQPPLVLIADDTGSEIEHRVRNCCNLMRQSCDLAAALFNSPGEFKLPSFDIKWSQSPNAADYLALSQKRRTLLLLDIAWAGVHTTQGLKIAETLLEDPEFTSRSILLLKSTEKAGRAASWAEPYNLSLRQLRVSRSVRLRLLAADRTIDGETNKYEQGMIAQALLDLQEEAVFDALNSGAWSAKDVGNAIEQIAAADFYGAFAGDKNLGRLYMDRILKRYYQRLSPSYPQGPLNIGVAHVMSNRTPNRLLHEADNLLTPRAPASAALVSALLDYGELAAGELFLFTLPLEDKDKKPREVGLKLNDQPWKPDKMSSAGILRRRADLLDARQALADLPASVRSKAGFPMAKLMDALIPAHIPDVLEANRLIADVRSNALTELPATIAELVETLLDDIERALSEGLLPDFEGVSQFRSGQPPEFLTLEWDFQDPDPIERIVFQRKRVRLLNRRLFEHPAVEAARIMTSKDGSQGDRIVNALKAYIQSPDAISALSTLLEEDIDTFSKVLAVLSDTDANTCLPTDFAAFDKLWKEHWSGKTEPAALKFLQEPDFADSSFGKKINEWNTSDAGRLTPIVSPKVSLLEMLVAHLAILEFRIRTFCVIIGNAAETKEWKNDLAKNLMGLWKSRGWDRIFTQTDIIDSRRKSFDPGVKWTGHLLKALNQNPKAGRYCGEFKGFLAAYETQFEYDGEKKCDKLKYKSSPPAWLRVGNVTLPLEIIMRNLADREPELLASNSRTESADEMPDQEQETSGLENLEVEEKLTLLRKAAAGDNKAKQTLMSEYDLSEEEMRSMVNEYVKAISRKH